MTPRRPATGARVPAAGAGALADTVLDRLTRVYPTAADPERGARTAAYMKGIAPFLGIPTAERRALSRTVLDGTPAPSEADCAAIALRCWELPEREYRHFALDLLRAHAPRLRPGFLPVARHLVETDPWWDTVDLLAANVVGPMVTAAPELAVEMDRWIDDDDRWIARTALLHQLGYREATDTERLFGYCLRRAGDTDFFLRKAIGWCLRQYARTDPDAVTAFVAGARDRLSPLSVREALKHIGPA